MRACFRFFCGLAAIFVAAAALSGSPASDESILRLKLTRALLGPAAERPALLVDLGNSGSRVVREVLTGWTHDGVARWTSPDGKVIPVMPDDQTDAQGLARAVRVDTGAWLKDARGADLRIDPAALAAIETDGRLRTLIQQALDTLQLSDSNPDVRHAAVVKLGNSQKLSYLPILRARRVRETDAGIRRAIDESIGTLELNSADPEMAAAAADRLGSLGALGSLDALGRVIAASPPISRLHRAAVRAKAAVEQHIAVVNFFGTIFRGVSLGSILLVVALGLAITFGLMGVINMAHGEMIAVGAYTCYVVQNLFGSGFAFAVTLPFSFGGKPLAFGFSLPGLNATGWWYESYFLFALPLSFLAAALVGAAVERTVIRFLYRRPLESLLATWGLSLILQQLFRMVFGANNVQVNSPSWLLGHFEIHDVSFGYNRVFVVLFAIAIVIGTWLLLNRTPMGLLIRAVMQNRDMASCLGVRNERVNLLTFAFGSGLAGLAGAFLSQIGNVGPSLGQSYIIDAFMTVVVGGVGNVAGTVVSAAAIGTSDQVLQQVLGSPVLGKIIVLGAIILFLQWKPGGLFAAKSRNLDG